MQFKSLALAAFASVATAQNMSICDKYTTALLMENTAANQLTLLTLLVNTVVIGNYSNASMMAVPGILAPGMVNGTAVDLLQYFNGSLASSNRGGSSGVAVNFLDGGGAAPLMMNMPANSTSSNQYLLLTHLYQFFGTLLGCSQQGMGPFPSYQGHTSQYQVHKFMGLSYAEVTYFIQQVAYAAASFGVATSDIQMVGTALGEYFNVRCAPAVTLAPSLGMNVLESICVDNTCPLAVNATCSAYTDVLMDPTTANSSNMYTASPSASATASGTVAAATTAAASGTTPAPSASKTIASSGAGMVQAGSLAALLAVVFGVALV